MSESGQKLRLYFSSISGTAVKAIASSPSIYAVGVMPSLRNIGQASLLEQPESALANASASPKLTDMNEQQLLSRITIDPQVCHGKPCVRGLRYPVEMILELLSGGMSFKQILADYEDLREDDLRAACAYGARVSHLQRIEPFVA